LVHYRLAKNIVSNTLRVYVGEHWPERPITRWVLLDAAGQLLQQGESDALRWPAAEFCEAILSAADASMLRVAIPPRVSRSDLAQVVAGAIEDQLLDDVDRCHLTICARQRETVDVLVIARQRLRNVLAQFAALNRPLSAAYSELQCLPANPEEWIVALTAEMAIVARPDAVPMTLDREADGIPPLLIEAMSRQAGNSPQVSVLPAPMQSVALPNWKAQLNTELVVVGAEYRWYVLADRPADLMHGEFIGRQKKSSAWLLVKPAALVAGAALVAHLLVGLAQFGLQAYRIHQAEARIADLFRATFPNVPMVAPIAQARRQLDQLRETHGLSRSDEALTLLSALADVLGPDGQDAVRELTVADHRLTVVLESALAGRLADLRQMLSERGYQVTSETTPQSLPSLAIEPGKMK
jgi:general secretion pathway protein L